jgi:phage shock protein PspC (stress-responsive transcriptional regulator)
MLAGVCAGIARYLNIDVAFIRIGWILLTIATVPLGVITYIVLAIALQPDDVPVKRTTATSHPKNEPQPPQPKDADKKEEEKE